LEVVLEELKVVCNLFAIVIPDARQILLVHFPLCRPGFEPRLFVKVRGDRVR
jgi:hypothetical protein